MLSLEILKAPHQVVIGASPNDADMAIVSIDDLGTPGELNMMVMKEYGYSEKDIPHRDQLRHGFGAVSTNKKEILFVVTVGNDDTISNIRENLHYTLEEFAELMTKRKVWIPLMGTGDGGLTLGQSYTATVATINNFLDRYNIGTTFILSIPNSIDGIELFDEVYGKTKRQDSEKSLIIPEVNYFLAGSIWEGEEQADEFYEYGVWENGYNDKYIDLINSVKEGDIIFLKSAFAAKNGISYLRIKGAGIVTKNNHSGTQLDIDWKIKNVEIDIEHLGKYRSTFSKISQADIDTIIKHIQDEEPDSGLFKTNSAPESNTIETAQVNNTRIAGLLSDSDKGIDYLDITKDVNAFARVIAAKSFEPPLAIALFGKWGSGKSFFMRKLKEQVISLSAKIDTDTYCNGVAHIHFNAWSYMDANLWASIVTKIFEGLNEYITENSKGDTEKKEIENKLATDLAMTKKGLNILENQKVSVNKRIDELTKQKTQIKEELHNKLIELEKKTTWDILINTDSEFKAKEKILKSLNQNDSYIQSEEELKRIIPEEYWSNPEKAYQQIKSKYTFLKEFFRRDKIRGNLIWLSLILLVIYFAPAAIQLISNKINTANLLIPQAELSFLVIAGTIWRRAEKVYSQIQPVIASFWTIKDDYDKKVKEDLSKFEQAEKILKLNIEKDEAQILILNEQIQKAEFDKLNLEFKINNALATEALYDFIDRRSKSDDYKKHLGIISIVRKDFETLNDLFTGHNLEARKARDAAQFKEQFKKPLERIILYIDDLDRCPEENVVQVLEAVNLLMAFPLFIVIVGVDSRWVKNALIKKHALQFTGALNGSSATDKNLEIIDPSSYLEKIFQVPFHLKDAKDSNVKDMVRSLAQINPRKPIIKSLINQNDIEYSELINIEFEEEIATASALNEVSIEASINAPIDSPEALILSETEISMLQEMSEIIGNNPRAIKRYVNVFRIIKAHEGFNYSQTTSEIEMGVTLFLLALPLGKYQKLLKSFEEFIMNDENNGSVLNQYLHENYQLENLQPLKNQLNVILSDKTIFNQLQNTPLELFKDHYSFIKRFAFTQE